MIHEWIHPFIYLQTDVSIDSFFLNFKKADYIDHLAKIKVYKKDCINFIKNVMAFAYSCEYSKKELKLCHI